ncbi:MAG: stage V sporulation protein AC [Candidatus Desulforudis sp.]|nr:stage V sporulation protein AC [Desulforudis sp.]
MRVDFTKPAGIQRKQYRDFVDRISPKPNVLVNVIWAFLVGGLVTTIGQGLLTLFLAAGLPVLEAGAMTAVVLIFIAALLTGLGVFDDIAKYAGAGVIVPITGFANSMVAQAMEARNEGLVLGVGARLFTIAGPVLVFGIVVAWFAGLFYFLFR